MAKRDRLPEIEEERGEPLDTLIPRLLNEHGTPDGAADELDVHPNTIRRWMKKKHVQRVVEIRFVLPEPEHGSN